MDLLEFAKGPALQYAAYILVAGSIWRLVGILLLKEKPDFSEPRQSAGLLAALKVIYTRSFTAAPFKAATLYPKMLAYVMHLGFFANTPYAYGYLLFLVFAVEINDIAAYTFGKMFGKRKLREEISPNKTMAGSVGAFAVSLVLPWLLWFSFPHFDPLHLVLTGIIVGVGGQLGDLVISYIKRDIGIKDMGTTIKGHGGILDRVDSMIFVAPIFFHMVRWFHGIG